MSYHLNRKILKNSLFVLILSTVSLGYSQTNPALTSLDTINSNQEKLDHLGKTIISQLYSNPENIGTYAKLFDSIATIEKTPENAADALNYQGIAHYVAQEYEQAINYYLEATRLLEAGEKGSKLSRVYNNLAACYNIRNDFENTEKYFLKSLEISEAIDDEPWVANLNNNLAVLYMNNKLYPKADARIENALTYYKQQKDSLMMGITYMNYGNSKVYGEDFPSAIQMYAEAMDLVAYEKFPLLYAVSQSGTGIALTKQNNFSKAEGHLQRGLEIAKKINHQEQVKESYAALADFYSETKDYKNAYELSLESQKLKDSILTATQDQNMAEALTKFESEKKDAQLKVLSLEREQAEQQQRLYLYLALAGLLIAGLVGFFLYRNQKQNRLLAKQKALLEVTVDEKNVLLKETHHRVKNSFQIVSSLLYLQSENIQDKEAQLAMKEAQNRVRSMVLIHQKLYNKDQLVGINSEEYFKDLTHDIFESHQFEDNRIGYSLDVEPLVLGIETITPLGLILNEMITNVLKHAFETVTEHSEMKIQFKRNGEQLILEVADNGKGMPSEIKESSFGIKLIKALAKKLKAQLQFPETTKGTLAVLHINRFTEL